VDTTDQAVNRLGELCPNLRELKLNDSQLCSFRDLGTSLRNLRILWLSRSGITDLDGISVLERLEELYVSFNDIDDLTPLSLHDTLAVLDLEANKVCVFLCVSPDPSRHVGVFSDVGSLSCRHRLTTWNSWNTSALAPC